jgi:hypothetical protein
VAAGHRDVTGKTGDPATAFVFTFDDLIGRVGAVEVLTGVEELETRMIIQITVRLH